MKKHVIKYFNSLNKFKSSIMLMIIGELCHILDALNAVIEPYTIEHTLVRNSVILASAPLSLKK